MYYEIDIHLDRSRIFNALYSTSEIHNISHADEVIQMIRVLNLEERRGFFFRIYNYMAKHPGNHLDLLLWNIQNGIQEVFIHHNEINESRNGRQLKYNNKSSLCAGLYNNRQSTFRKFECFKRKLKRLKQMTYQCKFEKRGDDLEALCLAVQQVRREYNLLQKEIQIRTTVG